MADMYERFGENIARGLYSIADAKDKKRTMEEEYAQRMKLIQEQSRLQDQELTPEQKLMRMYQGNPQGFTQFRQALDPNAPAEMELKRGALGIQQGNLDLDRQYKNYQMNNQSTARQRDLQFLMQLPGMTQEKALQYLFRPDMMQQFMQGMMGGGAPQTGMQPPGWAVSGGGSNFGQ